MVRLSVLDRVGCPRMKLMLCSSRPKTEEKELIHRFLSYFLAPRVLFIRAMQYDFVCHLFVSLLQSIVENEKGFILSQDYHLKRVATAAIIYSCFSISHCNSLTPLTATSSPSSIVHGCIIIKIIIISSLHHQGGIIFSFLVHSNAINNLFYRNIFS